MTTIIGGSGFVGTRLSNRLTKASTAFNIVDKDNSLQNPSITSICDIRDKELLIKQLKGSNLIINLAAEHRDDVSPLSLYDDVNVEGSRNVCAAAEANGINKIIFTSSVAVYGEVDKETDESGEFNFFNDYGRTKKEAEDVYLQWQKKDPDARSLVIIRPTVIFGEENRGNVYNLLKQLSSGFFPMVGNGKNSKSLAFVENVAAFLEYSIDHFGPGVEIFNYIDKPDYDMNSLVSKVNGYMGRKAKTGFHWPYAPVFFGGLCFDLLAKILRKKLPISSIRVKKFCMTTHFATSIFNKTDFKAPVSLDDGLKRTVEYEFLTRKEHE